MQDFRVEVRCDDNKERILKGFSDEPVVGILIEASAAREDDESHLSITKHRELISLLEQPITPLAESDLSVRGVLDPLDLDLASSRFPLGRGRVR